MEKSVNFIGLRIAQFGTVQLNMESRGNELELFAQAITRPDYFTWHAFAAIKQNIFEVNWKVKTFGVTVSQEVGILPTIFRLENFVVGWLYIGGQRLGNP
jgi:hypothetical protein